MKQSIQFWIASGIALCCLATTSPTKAQIIPDATLPNNSSISSEDNTSIITGGTRAGGNLFHSFEQFSVPTGSAAYFNNALEIQNIISRVTGSSVSNIDGKLQANASANFFLLNPNGIIFGPNATLSIGGSFLASTASAVNFADGTQFSATAHPTTPLLTVSVPLGLQFAGNARSIQVQGNGQGIRKTTNLIDTTVGLRVQPDRTLALVGGDVALEGGTLKTAGGRIELGSVAGPGLVNLTPIDKGWALGYEDVPNFPSGRLSAYGDIQLSSAATVDASGAGGGDVQVRGRRVTIQDGSPIEASTLGAEPGGTLNVTASESVELSGISADGQFPSGLFTQVYPGATGAGGNLTVETGRLTLRAGAQVSTNTFGPRRGGNLAVRASDSIELSQSSLLALVAREATGTGGNLTVETGRLTVGDEALVATSTSGTGSGGNLAIATGQLIVQDGAQVQAATFGAGHGGNLVVRASESVELIGKSAFLSTSVQQRATGAGGNLTIETGRLNVQDGAQIGAATSGAGQGGILTINASDSVELSGASPTATLLRGSSGLFVSAEPGATNNVGDLRITTGQLIVQNGAKISADNFGTGQAGTATVNVGQLIVRDGGLVRSGSFGEGPGGTLSVNASESVEVSGTGTIGPDKVNSTLFTQAEAAGDAGNLTIRTGSLIVRDGAELTVSSEGSGKAGELSVQARSIRLENLGAIAATTTVGNGGDITLQLQDLLLLRRNSQISTTAGTAQAGGDGGSITIDTPFIVAAKSENSDITANAFEGAGGFIQIKATHVFGLERREQLTPLSDITAFSEQNPELNGVVEINTLDVDPSRGLVNLPAEVVDASRLIASGCGALERQGQSEFIVTGRGGLPSNPSDTLSSDTVWSDLRPHTQQAQNRTSFEQATQQTLPTAGQIVEAQGWVINNKGEVVLTASAPTVTPHSPGLTATACHGS